MIDKAKFYDSIRSKINLTTQNVVGFDKHLDYIEQHGIPVDKAAYALATSSWETNMTMHPVKEAYWLSEDWRKRNLRYYPWYGRGLVQVTWEDNYRKMGKELGVDFIVNPNLMLEWEYALPALFVGMEKGLYTGKDLDDYVDGIDESDAEDLREYTNARRIVNGTDRAVDIAKRAIIFEHGLRDAGYVAGAPVVVPPVVEPPVVPPVVEPPVVEPPISPPSSWLVRLFRWLFVPNK